MEQDISEVAWKKKSCVENVLIKREMEEVNLGSLKKGVTRHTLVLQVT